MYDSCELINCTGREQ